MAPSCHPLRRGRQSGIFYPAVKHRPIAFEHRPRVPTLKMVEIISLYIILWQVVISNFYRFVSQYFFEISRVNSLGSSLKSFLVITKDFSSVFKISNKRRFRSKHTYKSVYSTSTASYIKIVVLYIFSRAKSTTKNFHKTTISNGPFRTGKTASQRVVEGVLKPE